MNTASQRAVLVGISFALPLAVLHALSNTDPSLSHSWLRLPEQELLDVGYHVRAAVRRPDPPETLRLVLEDDRSRDRTEGYTSDWDFLSALTNKLADDHPRAIFLDYQFETASSVERLGQQLQQVRTEARQDGVALGPFDAKLGSIVDALLLQRRFLGAVGRSPVVLPMFCAARELPGQRDDAALALEAALLDKSSALAASDARSLPCHQFTGPQPELVAGASGLAQDEFAVDGDGVIRREQMLLRAVHDGHPVLVPGAGAVVAALALGVAPDTMRLDDAGLHVGDRVIALGPDGSAMIDFTGANGSFLRLSRQGHPVTYTADTVLDGSVPRGAFTDKVVLVGDARAVTPDLKATPFNHQPKMPGVEAMAIAAVSVLEKSYPLRRPALADKAGFLLTLLLWAGGAWAGVALPLRTSLRLALAIPLLVLGAGIALLAGPGIWIDTAYPAAGWTVALLAAAITRNRIEDAERGFLHDAFSKYLSPKQVEVLLQDPKSLRLYGVERELTILFADLRGFTSRTERLPAAEMVALLNEHLTAMSRVIQQHDGILDKYIGDCVMAFWGAPIEDPQHALHACVAGLKMQETLAQENARRAAKGREQLAIGVGICSGKVIVGNMGSELKFDYTVIGDAVNLASRLEGLTKDAGYGVLIGERTRELLGDTLPIDELGPMKVKGKLEAVRVFGLRASRAAGYGAVAAEVGDAAGASSGVQRSSRPA